MMLHDEMLDLGLTELEAIKVVNGACADFVNDVLRYMLRRERHDDEDKPADLE